MRQKKRPQDPADTPGRLTRSVDPASGKQPRGRHRAAGSARAKRKPVRFGPTSTPLRLALATAAVGGLGFVAFDQSPQWAGLPRPASPAALAERDATAADQPASRSHDRAAGSPPPAAKPSAPAVTTPPRPVAGLTRAQMDNARAIVEVGVEQKVPRFGLIVAVATAMQESNLYNLASGALPESKNYPHQGTGFDHDSVGLFQQRSSTGWGPVRDLMRPAYAAERFFRALKQVQGWERLSLTQAAQRVQKSAFPDAYAKHETRATTVVDALLS